MRCAHRAVELSPTFRIACCQGSNECAPTACHEPRRTAPSRRSLVHAAHDDVVSSSRARAQCRCLQAVEFHAPRDVGHYIPSWCNPQCSGRQV